VRVGEAVGGTAPIEGILFIGGVRFIVERREVGGKRGPSLSHSKKGIVRIGFVGADGGPRIGGGTDLGEEFEGGQDLVSGVIAQFEDFDQHEVCEFGVLFRGQSEGFEITVEENLVATSTASHRDLSVKGWGRRKEIRPQARWGVGKEGGTDRPRR
jgi:hypothetical protein